MKASTFALISACLAGFWLVSLSVPAGAETENQSRPVLRDFLLTTLDQHPALREAEAELDSARAHARGQAQPLYNPELELGYEEAGDKTKEVGLSQTFDISGKRSARASVASAEVTAAEARLAIVQKKLLGDLLTSLSEYQTRHAALGLAEKRVELHQDFLALAERRTRAGDLPQSELLTARLMLAEARAEESAARIEFSLAEERLLAVVGDAPPVWPTLEDMPPQAVPPVEAVALESLPELRLATAEIAASRSRIRVAKKNRIPDPTLGVRIGEESTFTPLGQRESSTLFGLTLSIPLPVRNSYSAEVDAAGADLIAAEQSYRNLSRRIEARLEASHRRYEAALGAWRAWREQGATPLDEQRELLQKLWEAGEINAIDYIVQLNQTFSTESAGVALRGRLWAAWFAWLEASGSVDEWVETL